MTRVNQIAHVASVQVTTQISLASPSNFRISLTNFHFPACLNSLSLSISLPKRPKPYVIKKLGLLLLFHLAQNLGCREEQERDSPFNNETLISSNKSSSSIQRSIPLPFPTMVCSFLLHFLLCFLGNQTASQLRTFLELLLCLFVLKGFRLLLRCTSMLQCS